MGGVVDGAEGGGIVFYSLYPYAEFVGSEGCGELFAAEYGELPAEGSAAGGAGGLSVGDVVCDDVHAYPLCL